MEPYGISQEEAPGVVPTVFPGDGKAGLERQIGGERQERLEHRRVAESRDPTLLHRETRQVLGDSAGRVQAYSQVLLSSHDQTLGAEPRA